MTDVIGEFFLFNPFDWDSKRIEQFNNCIISVCAGICTCSIPYFLTRAYEHQLKIKVEKELQKELVIFMNKQKKTLEIVKKWALNNKLSAEDCYIVKDGLVRVYPIECSNLSFHDLRLKQPKPLAEIDYSELIDAKETGEMLRNIFNKINTNNRYAQYISDELYDNLFKVRYGEFYCCIKILFDSFIMQMPCTFYKFKSCYSDFEKDVETLIAKIESIYKNTKYQDL
jgi:hypothetical protein